MKQTVMNIQLEDIQSPADLHGLNTATLEKLAGQLRTRLIKVVAKNGGHLSSNLGVVELTLALLTVFQPPQDAVIWDVGHQSYVYKILTGRNTAFETLRQENGLAGFPKRSESPFDAFNTGHSTTSLSAALGICRAKKMNHDQGYTVAVIGDGAMSGGMAYEALNNIAKTDEKLIIILNDNQMSIDQSVGSVARYFEKIRVQPSYIHLKHWFSKRFFKLPCIGKFMKDRLTRIKSKLRRAVRPKNIMFESFGVRYYGPVDGHDIEMLQAYFEAAKQYHGPVLIHVHTQKGKGYLPAETMPTEYHGVAPFVIEQGGIQKQPQTTNRLQVTAPIMACQTFSDAFSLSMVNLTDYHTKIVAVTAAMASGTGLLPFKAAKPHLFYDVGIAEPHAVTMAAGFATQGIIPIVAIYSTFLQRAFDQIVHDVILQDLHVVFAIDRAGVVGADGETHQGLYDRAWLRSLPNVTVLEPRDYASLDRMLKYAVDDCCGPVFIRYPRGKTTCPEAFMDGHQSSILAHHETDIYKPIVLTHGSDVTVVAMGNRVGIACAVSERLRRDGIFVEVIDCRQIHPLDTKPLLASIEKTNAVVVIEEAIRMASVGEALLSDLCEKQMHPVFKHLCLPDGPIEQATQEVVWSRAGIDEAGCLRACLDVLQVKRSGNQRDSVFVLTDVRDKNVVQRQEESLAVSESEAASSLTDSVKIQVSTINQSEVSDADRRILTTADVILQVTDKDSDEWIKQMDQSELNLGASDQSVSGYNLLIDDVSKKEVQS